MSPIWQFGNPDDVSPIVAFLASDAAVQVARQTISVNGGFTMV